MALNGPIYQNDLLFFTDAVVISKNVTLLSLFGAGQSNVKGKSVRKWTL
jgi:hypothetical protein